MTADADRHATAATGTTHRSGTARSGADAVDRPPRRPAPGR